MAADLECVDTSTGELVPYQPVQPPATLFRSDEPGEILVRTTEIANALAPVIEKQQLFTMISGRKHVRVEGWTLLGTMLGVFPVCTWTRPLENGWEARVEARTRDGAIVGAAEAQCLRSESTWASRDDYALRSMAQTRATSKALRQPLGFVMGMAGFESTPAEEMTATTVTAPAAAPTVSGGTGQLASQPQVKMVTRLIIKLGVANPPIHEDTIKAGMLESYGTGEAAELTKQQASDLITRLKAAAGEE